MWKFCKIRSFGDGDFLWEKVEGGLGFFKFIWNCVCVSVNVRDEGGERGRWR